MTGPSIVGDRYLEGTLLGNRYEVRSLLGRGGMAEVYEAVDRLLSRPVAVKVLRSGLASDRRFLARFRREARAAASLTHPAIVAVFDVGVGDDRPFLVMELVRGRTLADLIEDAPLPPARAARIARQVAEALAYAHDQGIVHRDVAPGNVMITARDDVKVLDFGIARALSWTPLTGSPSLHGTASYISPEQARGGSADERSDIYSLGVVLYEMLTGRPPFSGDSAVAVAYRHMEETPIPLRVLVPDVPEDLERIVMRCLAKDPAGRYRDADDLAGELEQAGTQHHGASPAWPPPTEPLQVRDRAIDGRAGRRSHTAALTIPQPTTTRRRRSWRWLGWLAVLSLLAASGVAGAMLLTPDRERSSPRTTVPPPPQLFPPTEIAAVGTCDGFLKMRVDLSWAPSRSVEAAGYEVFRSPDVGGIYEPVAKLPGLSTTTFSDTGRGAEETSYYVIRTYTAGGRHSADSPEVAAETPFFCLF